MMDSRIRSNVARGRSIINDSAILPLFEKLTNWHGEVLARMAKLDEDRGMGYLLFMSQSNVPLSLVVPPWQT